MNGRTPGAGQNPLGEGPVSWALLHAAGDDTDLLDLLFPFLILQGLHLALHHSRALAPPGLARDLL